MAAFGLVGACGGSSSPNVAGSGDGGGGGGGDDAGIDAQSDGGTIGVDAGGGIDSGSPPLDAGSGWTPVKMTCPTPGSYKQNSSGSCGTLRWSIKTGTDSAAGRR